MLKDTNNTELLLNKEHKCLINIYKKNNNDASEINNDLIKSLRNKELITISTLTNEIVLTKKGELYCEQWLKKNADNMKENLLKWGSFILSVIAIILSIASITIQYLDYSTSNMTESISDIIDNTTENILVITNNVVGIE